MLQLCASSGTQVYLKGTNWKIFVIDMLSMNIFFQTLFGKKMFGGFSSDFEKIVLLKQQQHQNSPPSHKPTPIKFWHDEDSISGPRERVHRSFMK